MIKNKICIDCSVKKSIKEFYKRNNYSNTNTVYYKGYCKDCTFKRVAVWKKANKERFNEYHKKYAKNKYWSMTPKERKIANKKAYKNSTRAKLKKSK